MPLLRRAPESHIHAPLGCASVCPRKKLYNLAAVPWREGFVLVDHESQDRSGAAFAFLSQMPHSMIS